MPGNNTFGALLVFLLSTKCNLECIYCNVDAGPHGFRPMLDPHIFEKWIEAFALLGSSEIAIQLHGGEPLVADLPVELFAAVARNALVRFPKTKLTDVAVQSNGLALDESRLDSLAKSGVRINISIDGPAAIHDRQRPTAMGRGSHQDAVRAHRRLRARGKNTGVIAVVTDPADVIPALRFFLEDGFREARMNPMRPQGRAVLIREWNDEVFMRDMALEYLRAAKLIASHNTCHPDTPFFEQNLAEIMESLIGESNEGEPAMLYWTFLIDDRGDLWAHPGGHGRDDSRLTRGEVPNVVMLRRALGLDEAEEHSNGLVCGLRQWRDGLFQTCASCRTPNFCVPRYGPREDARSAGPVCIWRSELMDQLDGWLRCDPHAAHQIARTCAPSGHENGGK